MNIKLKVKQKYDKVGISHFMLLRAKLRVEKIFAQENFYFCNFKGVNKNFILVKPVR